MCGITGFYTPNNQTPRAEMHAMGAAMANSLTHRGPDSGAVWQEPDLPLLLAHRRLAILDLSAEGAQPMISASGRYVITYNGEIYNFQTLKKDLVRRGITFKGRSDTEVLLAAIEEWGLNQTLQKINGMFAFALWDRKTRLLHFIRDRLGKKPLYIGWAGSTLIFGSELKALHAHKDFDARINQYALALFLRYGYLPAPHSIYKNIWQLPPGQRLTLELQSLEPRSNLHEDMQPYWSAPEIAVMSKYRPNMHSKDYIIGEFEALLMQCIEERMISDVPIGAFLSGGIDSTIVTALMQKKSAFPVKTYSIGFREKGFNEAHHAKKISKYLETDHHEYYCSPEDVLNVIPKLPVIYDEPFADASAIPTYLLSRFARKDVTVALSGDGGDEMLGGYTRHTTGPKIYNITRTIPKPLRRLIGGVIGKIPASEWEKLNVKKPLAAKHIQKGAAIMAYDDAQTIYDHLIGAAKDIPVLDKTTHQASWFNQLEGLGIEKLSMAEKIMLWDTMGYLPDDILTKVDRASMANSLEVRAPLLDQRIVEYVWRLPNDLKIHKSQGKILLRKLLKRHVPEKLFDRPKQGFTLPLQQWLKNELRDWAEDLLDENTLKAQGHLDAKIVHKIWKDHLKGRQDNTNALWNILMFQAWLKRWP